MKYLISGVVGLAIGAVDLLLLLLVLKIEKLDVRKYVWIVLLGMPLIAVYFMWLIEGWEYVLGIRLLLSGYLLPLTIVDCKYKQLPDLFHIVYSVAFILYKLICGTWYDLINGALGAVCIFVLLGAVHLVKKDQFGLGDLKALCVCAFLVGIPGIIYIFFRGLIVAAIYSVVQLLRRRAGLKTEYPLMPFLLAGVLI